MCCCSFWALKLFSVLDRALYRSPTPLPEHEVAVAQKTAVIAVHVAVHVAVQVVEERGVPGSGAPEPAAAVAETGPTSVMDDLVIDEDEVVSAPSASARCPTATYKRYRGTSGLTAHGHGHGGSVVASRGAIAVAATQREEARKRKATAGGSIAPAGDENPAMTVERPEPIFD